MSARDRSVSLCSYYTVHPHPFSLPRSVRKAFIFQLIHLVFPLTFSYDDELTVLMLQVTAQLWS